MGRIFTTIFIGLFLFASFVSIRNEEKANAVDNEFLLDASQKKISIGVVMRTFTKAAYSGYYAFFINPTLNASKYLIREVPTETYMKSIAIYALQNEGFSRSQIHVIDDRTVHKGDIFTPEGLPKYDVLIFLHNEYVTLEEYHNMARFVKAGGNVIILNANAFFGEVEYNESIDKLALLAGHLWEFDGENGTKMNVYKSRFFNTKSTMEHFDWIGSRYQIFRKGSMQGAVMNSTGNNPHPLAVELTNQGYSIIGEGYSSHEENTVITPNIHTIATWRSSFQQPDRGIRIYEKFPFGPYGGSIIHLGIFSVETSSGSSSILKQDKGLRTFLKEAILHQKGILQHPWIKYPYDGGVFSDENIPVVFNNPQNVTGTYLNGTEINLKSGELLKGLQDGTYNLTITYGVTSRTAIFRIDRKHPTIFVNGKPFNASQTFETGQWVNVTATDPNINYLRGYVHNGIHSQEWHEQLTSSGTETNISMSYRVQGNETKTMFVQAIDGAGNTITRWIRLNPNGTVKIAPQTMPIAKAINSTHAMVIIPPFPNETYVELQVGNIWTKEWTSYPFKVNGTNPNNGTAIAIFPHNGKNIVYRVAARVNNRTRYYYSIQKFPGNKNILWLESKEKAGNMTLLTIGMLRQPFSNYSIAGLTADGNRTIIENVSKTLISENRMEVKIPTSQLEGIHFLMLSGRNNYSIPIYSKSIFIRSYNAIPSLTQPTTTSTSPITTSPTSSTDTPHSSTTTSSVPTTDTPPSSTTTDIPTNPTTNSDTTTRIPTTTTETISQTSSPRTGAVPTDIKVTISATTKVTVKLGVTDSFMATNTITSTNTALFAEIGMLSGLLAFRYSNRKRRRPHKSN